MAVELSGLSVSPCPDLLQLHMYVSYFQSLMVCLHFVACGDFFPSIAAKGPRSQPALLLLEANDFRQCKING